MRALGLEAGQHITYRREVWEVVAVRTDQRFKVAADLVKPDGTTTTATFHDEQFVKLETY